MHKKRSDISLICGARYPFVSIRPSARCERRNRLKRGAAQSLSNPGLSDLFCGGHPGGDIAVQKRRQFGAEIAGIVGRPVDQR